MFVTNKFGSIMIYSHVWYIFWISMTPGVLWYIIRSHLTVCWQVPLWCKLRSEIHNQQSQVSSVHVHPYCIKADKKRKLKLKISIALVTNTESQLDIRRWCICSECFHWKIYGPECSICGNCDNLRAIECWVVVRIIPATGLLAAIAWPAALIGMASVIDNPWSVCTQRSLLAGRQLAEVLLSRQQVCCYGNGYMLLGNGSQPPWRV